MITQWKKKNYSKSNYWHLSIKEKKNDSEDNYKIFLDKLTNSTKHHLRSDVPIALYLSGGIDSSTLACISKKILKNTNIDAFNLKFKNELRKTREKEEKLTKNTLNYYIKSVIKPKN